MKIRGYEPHAETELSDRQRRQAIGRASFAQVGAINPADSSEIANDAGPAAFDVSHTIQRGLLENAGAVRLYFAGKFSAAGGGQTLELRVSVNGTVIATTGPVTIAAAATDAGWSLRATIVCRKPGGAGEIIAHLDGRVAGQVVTSPAGAPLVVDTGTDLIVTASTVWGATDPGNKATLQTLLPEHL